MSMFRFILVWFVTTLYIILYNTHSLIYNSPVNNNTYGVYEEIDLEMITL